MDKLFLTYLYNKDKYLQDGVAEEKTGKIIMVIHRL